MAGFSNIFGGISSLSFLIPGLCTQLGISLKNKDDNETGFDDAGGNVVMAIGPVIPAFLSGNQTLIRRTLLAAYNAIGGYLGFTPRELPPATPTS